VCDPCWHPHTILSTVFINIFAGKARTLAWHSLLSQILAILSHRVSLRYNKCVYAERARNDREGGFFSCIFNMGILVGAGVRAVYMYVYTHSARGTTIIGYRLRYYCYVVGRLGAFYFQMRRWLSRRRSSSSLPSLPNLKTRSFAKLLLLLPFVPSNRWIPKEVPFIALWCNWF
jgi:hypothetical protein